MDNKEFLEKIKLLNDSTRLTILQMLSNNGTLCACKILEELSITQATLSHHMKLLSQANFVEVRRDGKWCYYTLLKENICEIANFIENICCPDTGDKKCSCKKA